MAKNPRARLWCFTHNNYTDEDVKSWKQFIKDGCKYGCIGLECGESGTPHIQGCMGFENARGFNALKRVWPTVHFEKGRNKIASLSYCKKEGKYWEYSPGAYIGAEDNLCGATLKKWQLTLYDRCEDFKRYRNEIQIYYDKKGGAGKTSFIRHYLIGHPKTAIMVSGGSNHIKYGVMTFAENKENNLEVVFFNCTRDSEIPYDAVECIHDATWFNTKYEAKMVLLNVYPLVVIMCNHKPDRYRLTASKYNIIEL